MITTYEAVRPLVDGKPVDIIEMNEKGRLVGAWIGYWNRKYGVVTLYPDVRNHFVNWPGGRIPGQSRRVSDRFIKVRNKVSAVRSVVSPGTSGAISETPKGETWRDRKLPMKGQERMDI